MPESDNMILPCCEQTPALMQQERVDSSELGAQSWHLGGQFLSESVRETGEFAEIVDTECGEGERIDNRGSMVLPGKRRRISRVRR
mmetsp:Transcript_18842/g.26526  ORF Transcript_18842/g.26526 Transcript_18842/m.26526 type:complete len:86 (+) Transcript_18842:392-649(+)